ncbi:hypothetical protein VNO78_22448 [Psophocarpus tetragonolobus]|uniref:Uncharacterized protein n=1 Tax=Psophocarpus tetragonolobus TaxID=3891 RepID=A0AAN9XCJ2_PSOTE
MEWTPLTLKVCLSSCNKHRASTGPARALLVMLTWPSMSLLIWRQHGHVGPTRLTEFRRTFWGSQRKSHSPFIRSVEGQFVNVLTTKQDKEKQSKSHSQRNRALCFSELI